MFVNFDHSHWMCMLYGSRANNHILSYAFPSYNGYIPHGQSEKIDIRRKSVVQVFSNVSPFLLALHLTSWLQDRLPAMLTISNPKSISRCFITKLRKEVANNEQRANTLPQTSTLALYVVTSFKISQIMLLFLQLLFFHH